ncbi:MAG: SAM-dependent methyltransferase [Porticoccaceae bacterium]|jgi:predicted O-methyltransferase YrrM|nr:SAM-dependent methyltransferase [Porticoccaceae bacterium]
MSNQSISLTPELYDYLLGVSLRESAVLRDLRARTAELPDSNMQIAPEQGQFMALLARLTGARRAIEVGVYTGYSALCVAAVLPPDGRLVGCDLSAEYTDIAREYWRRAGVAERIDLRLAPAAETLSALLDDEDAGGSFDFAFIDADKTGYAGYYEQCLRLLRPGGLIVVDNVLWNGRVLEGVTADEDTRAIQAFNRALRDDDRVDLSLVPIGDGLTLARKR